MKPPVALDEIVWTVNPSNDTLDGLINYICKNAQEYLAVAGLRYRLDVPAQLPHAAISPEARHNVFLAAKEAVTNVVRHARASEAWLRLRAGSRTVHAGNRRQRPRPRRAQEKAAESRNGLRNMRKRMEDVGGSFSSARAPQGGTLVRLTVPLAKLNICRSPFLHRGRQRPACAARWPACSTARKAFAASATTPAPKPPWRASPTTSPTSSSWTSTSPA